MADERRTAAWCPECARARANGRRPRPAASCNEQARRVRCAHQPRAKHLGESIRRGSCGRRDGIVGVGSDGCLDSRRSGGDSPLQRRDRARLSRCAEPRSKAMMLAPSSSRRIPLPRAATPERPLGRSRPARARFWAARRDQVDLRARDRWGGRLRSDPGDPKRDTSAGNAARRLRGGPARSRRQT